MLKPPRISLLCLLTAAAFGCEDDVVQPGSITRSVERASLRSQSSLRTYDDDLEDIAAMVPGFGGVYVDDAGALTVLLTDPSRISAAREPVRELIERVVLPGTRAEVARNQLLDGLRAESASFSFADLRAWYTAVTSSILSLDGVTFGDIDERRNRIVVGVRDFATGEVAWPALGGFTFGPNGTFFIESAGSPAAGATVHKVGRTTGHTSGSVTATCATIPQYSNGNDTGRTMLCSARASMAAQSGDSGSPALYYIGNAGVVDWGIVWGFNGSSTDFTYMWRQEIEPLIGGVLTSTLAPNVSVSGPTYVPPGVLCSWTINTGGEPPITYQWSGLFTGTSSTVWGITSSSGWLFGRATDEQGRWDEESIYPRLFT